MCRENIVFPDDKAAVTVLTNEDASSAAGALGRRIAPLVLSGAVAGAGERGGGGGGEAGAGDLYGIAGWEAGPVAADGVVRCVLHAAEAVQDFASSLKPLGAPSSFKQVAEEKRGGMTFRVFNVAFPGKAGARDGV